MLKNPVRGFFSVGLSGAATALAFGLALALGAARPAPGAPEIGQGITVRDGFGREVTLPVRPRRVVAYEAYEILPALGVTDRLVGISRYAKARPFLHRLIPGLDALPAPGTGFSVELERLVTLRPDLVLTWAWRCEVAERIEAQGIPVLAVYPRSVGDVLREIELLGRVFGREDRARQVVGRVRHTLRELEARLAGVPAGGRPRVLFLWGRPDRVAGGTGVQADLIRLAGGTNVARDLPELNPVVSQETIVAWQPDVVILWSNARYGPDDLAADPRWRRVPAVRHGRVFRAPRWYPWSPRLAALAVRYAAWLHPDRLPPDEAEAWIRDLHLDVFGVPPGPET